ncbi:MAG: CHASE sensor domain-containing protein, partial [Planctomycetota bacterium]
MKIRHKLTAIIMLTCVLSLVLVGALFTMWGHASFRNSMIHNLSTQAEMIADNCKASVAFDDPEDAKDTLSTLRLEPSIVHACVYTNDGKDFAEYYRKGIDDTVHLSEVLKDGHSFENGLLTVFKSITVDNEVIGSVCLRSDLKPLQAALNRNLFISRPILCLTEAAREVSENKEYSIRAAKQSDDEIGVLIDSFNEMLEQIQEHKTQLVEINESLEEKVNERTCELTKEITDRKKVEKKLKIFQRFAEESSQGVGWTDIDGNVIYINPALCRMLEEEKPDFSHGKPVARYYDEITQRRLKTKIFPAVLAEGQWIGELNIHSKKGKIVPTLNNLFVMRDENNKPLCFANTLTDITERKQAEKQRAMHIAELTKAKEQAEAANVAKSQFLATMSHEIRTPMNAIIGFSDLLSDEDLTDSQSQNVNIIRESGGNLLSLIN